MWPSCRSSGPAPATGDKWPREAARTRTLSRLRALAVAGVIAVDGEVRASFNRLSENQLAASNTSAWVYSLFIPGIADAGLTAPDHFSTSATLLEAVRRRPARSALAGRWLMSAACTR